MNTMARLARPVKMAMPSPTCSTRAASNSPARVRGLSAGLSLKRVLAGK